MAFGLGSPVAPSQARGQRGFVWPHDFKFARRERRRFSQEHPPTKLGDALGVAINADILAHGCPGWILRLVEGMVIFGTFFHSFTIFCQRRKLARQEAFFLLSV